MCTFTEIPGLCHRDEQHAEDSKVSCTQSLPWQSEQRHEQSIEGKQIHVHSL